MILEQQERNYTKQRIDNRHQSLHLAEFSRVFPNFSPSHHLYQTPLSHLSTLLTRFSLPDFPTMSSSTVEQPIHDAIIPSLKGINLHPTDKDPHPDHHRQLVELPHPLSNYAWVQAIKDFTPYTLEELLTVTHVRTPSYSKHPDNSITFAPEQRFFDSPPGFHRNSMISTRRRTVPCYETP